MYIIFIRVLTTDINILSSFKNYKHENSILNYIKKV